jgi:excisionase family DNA binding protein
MIPGDERSGERLPMPANEPDWLTLGQAAKHLGVAQSTIRKWSDSGRVPAFYTPGGHRRYRRADLDAFLASSGGSMPAAPRGNGGPRTILIVDDDARLREFVRVNLEMEGYAVREAGSAEEGLAVLDEEPPDLILLDVMMPQVDGWEMLRRMQERHGVGSIPVIMFSGKLDEKDLRGAQQRGAQGFIGKPFNPQQLIESTKQLLPT